MSHKPAAAPGYDGSRAETAGLEAAAWRRIAPYSTVTARPGKAK